MTRDEALSTLLEAVDELCDWLDYNDLELDNPIRPAVQQLNRAFLQYRISAGLTTLDPNTNLNQLPTPAPPSPSP